MKKILKKSLYILLAAVLVMTMGSGFAMADTAGGTADLIPISYTVDKGGTPFSSEINVNTGSVNINVVLKYAGKSSTTGIVPDVSKMVDSFNGGLIAPDNVVVTSDKDSFTITVRVMDLTYTGVGNSLKLMVGLNGDYSQITVPIRQCKEYEEPVVEPYVPETPDPSPAPMALFSRNEMPVELKAKEERVVTVYVKNVGTTTMTNPIISFSTSDSLILMGTSTAMQMKSIAPGKTESVDVPVKALGTISSANQYLNAELQFTYFNRISMVNGEASGQIIIPAAVKTVEEPEDDGTGSPVPNLIITNFSYGGGSVAAGSAFNLNFDFVNTSSELYVENVVVTVEGGEGFTINGATNTFYFGEIEEGGKESVSVPMKALTTVSNGALPVLVDFKYEYVDQQQRIPTTASAKMTVPVYQPDRFEIASPTVPAFVYAGEEISVMMNYVNKSKSPVSNVEARLEGNVDTYTPVQNIGNLEAGKSGTFAFAVTAWEVPETNFTIMITYEDANGDEKVREFPVTMTVEEMVFEDPGIYEPMPEPEPEPAVDWKIIAAVAAAAAVIAFFVIRKRKKAAALKKETEMWANWDDDMSAASGSADPSDGGAASGGETEASETADKDGQEE